MKVALWAEIRRLSEIEKLSGWAIARRLHCSRRTVAAALKLEQPPSSQATRRVSVLDPYVEQIKNLLAKYPALSVVKEPRFATHWETSGCESRFSFCPAGVPILSRSGSGDFVGASAVNRVNTIITIMLHVSFTANPPCRRSRPTRWARTGPVS